MYPNGEEPLDDVIPAAGPAPMDETEFQAVVAGAVQDACDFIDGTVAPVREELVNLYNGLLPEKPDPEVDGNRSGMVSRDVRDTVEAMMPSVMRVFFSSERVAEFTPTGPEDVALAEQATDYVNHVILQQNQGFTHLYNAMKSALQVKNGFVTWWWDTTIKVTTNTYSGLDPDALMILQSELGPEDTVEPIGQSATPDGIPLLDVRITRKHKTGKACFAAFPAEEFFIDRRASGFYDATVYGRRRYITASDAIEMGYPYEVVLEHIGAGDSFEENTERFTRNPAAEFPLGNTMDELSRRVLYIEAYCRVDRDGDGIAELRKVCLMGNGYKVVNDEAWEDQSITTFCATPTPFEFFGDCPADAVADIQLAKSGLWRAMMDSASQSVRPRMVAVEGQVNMRDLLSNDVGAVIRARAPGMVQPLDQPFVGQQVIPVLALLDEMRENRTGISKAAAGLDADALQSSTRAAVAATVSASQAQTEMVARMFAEGGWKDLVRGIYGLLKRHQDRATMVRLRNQWVPVDPRTWPADMDVTVNVALGRGSDEVRMGYLQQLAAEQKEILLTLGPKNPLTDLAKYRQTLADMTNLAGFRDADRYWNDPNTYQPGPEEEQGKEDPQQIVAKAQAEKDLKDAATRELDVKLKDDRERDKILVQALEMCAKTGYDPTQVLTFLLMPRGDGGTAVANGAAGVTPVPQLPAAPPPNPSNPMNNPAMPPMGG